MVNDKIIKLDKDHEIAIDNTKAQMRKGILEFCILLVISEEKIYANDILKKLKQADLVVVEGTIYPLLTRLKNLDLLSYDWEESRSGPPRKYYTITDKGIITLKELKKTWEKFDKSINLLINNLKIK